ncbi:hypothetical protein MRX96_018156 [Rhipicephalus microplus]
MPTPRRPPAVSIEPLVPGSGSHRRRPAPPFGVEHPGAATAQRPRPGTSASTGVSAAASGPTRSLPPVIHQGIMTVYLPVPGILCCPYPCCAGCQARTSVSLRLSTWRSHMEQKHGVRPTRRLYRCVACDARLNSLSARHDCPGPASNEPFHPCRYCPRYFTCERSRGLAYYGTACARRIHSLRTSSHPTAAYGDFLQFFWYRELTNSRPSFFRYSSSSPAGTTDPSNRFPVSKTSWRPVFHIDAILEYRVGLQQYGYRFSVGFTVYSVLHTGQLSNHFLFRLCNAWTSTFGSRTANAHAPPTNPHLATQLLRLLRQLIRLSLQIHRPLVRVPPSSPLPEQIDDLGEAVDDDDAPDVPVDYPAMDMPPDNTALLPQQVQSLRATLRNPPTQDSWALCDQAWTQAVTIATEAVRLPAVVPASRSWTLDVADLLTLEALDVLAGPGGLRVLDGGR